MASIFSKPLNKYLRLQLIKLIYLKELSIKDASKELKINYSIAKNIYLSFLLEISFKKVNYKFFYNKLIERRRKYNNIAIKQ